MNEFEWEQLLTLFLNRSEAFFIEGAKPSTIEGFKFDIELLPNAVPVKHQLPRLSPAKQEKEQYHVAKAEKAGHLRVPQDHQKGPWSTRTLIVKKKDDPNGRWIADFRPLNEATVKRPTPIGDVQSKVRRLAGTWLKTALDAWSGFNQMAATERATQYLQIITSLGIRQYEVLPFGVTNGPPYFQEAMLDIYAGASSGLPNLLDHHMKEEQSYLGIFVDDVNLGTGDAYAENHDREGEFAKHVKALDRVLERAVSARLRFKLEKVYAFQAEVESLGVEVGQGVVRASSKKAKAIAVWPVPTKPEDVERFLASMVFIRDHLSPRFSAISKPLRDSLKDMQEARRDKKKAGYKKPQVSVKEGWWTEEMQQAFDS